VIEIKEGPDLDRAVAEAIGWRIDESRPLDWMGSNGLSVEEFRPSTDYNDAFRAAENLFGEYTIHKRGTDKYEFECYFEGDDGRSRCGEYASPCLAICAAILKVKRT